MQKLLNLINNSKNIVAFTGAGISTLSGIQDFRGKDGFFRDRDPDMVFNIDHFYSNPAFYYQKTKNLIYNLSDKKPNIIHNQLAAMEKQGIVKAIITQNIDMLHEKAGSKKIIELHGSPKIHYCIKCTKEYDYSQIQQKLKTTEVPLCDLCSGILKPKITFYGESLSEKVVDQAIKLISKADLVLILGSSLVVQPAASLPFYSINNGGKLAIINNLPTPLDKLATLHYPDLLQVFEYLNKNLKKIPDRRNSPEICVSTAS